jgi:hypothetical protein
VGAGWITRHAHERRLVLPFGQSLFELPDHAQRHGPAPHVGLVELTLHEQDVFDVEQIPRPSRKSRTLNSGTATTKSTSKVGRGSPWARTAIPPMIAYGNWSLSQLRRKARGQRTASPSPGRRPAFRAIARLARAHPEPTAPRRSRFDARAVEPVPCHPGRHALQAAHHQLGIAAAFSANVIAVSA